MIPLAQYRRAVAYLRPYRGSLTLVLALGLVATALGLVQPYISKLLIDEALLARNWRALVEVAALMVAVTALSFGLNILSGYRYVSLSASALFDMRLDLYRHLQRLSPRFYARAKLGDVVSRINNDIAEVQRVSADALLGLLSNVAFLVGSVAVMLWLNAGLFLVSAALLPVSILALRRYQRRLVGQVRSMRERSSDIGSFLIETLIGVRVVVAAGAEAREAGRFRRHNSRYLDALLGMQLTSSLAGALPGAVLAFSTAAVFLYGGKLVIDGALTIGGLVAFMAYHMRLLAPVQSLMALHTSLVTGAVSLGRVFEIFDVPVEVTERPDARKMGNASGEIVFDNVSFRYERQAAVLEGVSFRVPAGTSCAIVGPSGVGKSTIADLILRFYDPESGAVRLDGTDLRQLRLQDLRSAVALVDQEPYLFRASVAENIAYARPEASREEIVAAARAAAAHEFITALPAGYDTEIGERAQTLSAGERQRIAIARAMLQRPAVLVLDEPTAALDPATEASLAGTLAQVMRGRTTIMITHRAALAELADQALVLDSGRVVESGAPFDLLTRESALARHFRERQALSATEREGRR